MLYMILVTALLSSQSVITLSVYVSLSDSFYVSVSIFLSTSVCLFCVSLSLCILTFVTIHNNTTFFETHQTPITHTHRTRPNFSCKFMDHKMFSSIHPRIRKGLGNKPKILPITAKKEFQLQIYFFLKLSDIPSSESLVGVTETKNLNQLLHLKCRSHKQY